MMATRSEEKRQECSESLRRTTQIRPGRRDPSSEVDRQPGVRRGYLTTLCFVLATALAFPAAPVFAQDASTAATFYQQAAEAYQNGEYTRADRLLLRAYEADPDLIYQYNRILANEAADEFEAALKILDEFEEQMAADPDARFSDIAEVRERVQAALDEQSRAGETAEKTTRPDDAESASQEQGASARESSEQAPNSVKEVEIPGESSPNYLGWSLVGVGAISLSAAALLGSAVFLSDVEDRLNCAKEVDIATCYPYERPMEKYEDDVARWDVQRTLTIVTLGVGAAALLGAGLVFYLDDDDAQASMEPDASPDRPATAGAAIEITPMVGAGVAGGSVQLSF